MGPIDLQNIISALKARTIGPPPMVEITLGQFKDFVREHDCPSEQADEVLQLAGEYELPDSAVVHISDEGLSLVTDSQGRFLRFR